MEEEDLDALSLARLDVGGEAGPSAVKGLQWPMRLRMRSAGLSIIEGGEESNVDIGVEVGNAGREQRCHRA